MSQPGRPNASQGPPTDASGPAASASAPGSSAGAAAQAAPPAAILAQAAHAHPLDPLRAEEISAAVYAVRLTFGKEHPASSSICFIECTLEEPHPKDVPLLTTGDVRALQAIPRLARVITYNRDTNMTSEWLVALTLRPPGKGTRTKSYEGRVISQDLLKDVQPAVDEREFEEAERIVKEHPDFQAAMARRGITDMSLILADPWCIGYFKPEDGPARRLCRVLFWLRTAGGPEMDDEAGELIDNAFARPIEGLIVRIDLQKMEVVSMVDRELVSIPEPDPYRNYTNRKGQVVEDNPMVVRPLLPIQVKQPSGPSWKVEGNLVVWDKWTFRVGVTPREALIIYNAAFFDPDKARYRHVARRLSITEVLVPYGDPDDPHYFRSALDAGEDGLGKNIHTLEEGVDVIGHCHFFDLHFPDFTGGLVKVPNAVAMYEEDCGVLWKHIDWRTGHIASKRSRRLVLAFMCTIGNYGYGFFWYFYRDGTIQHEVKLTGTVMTGVAHSGKSRKYGTLLDGKTLYAPIHSHWFVARMHMAVDTDGMGGNSLVEVNMKTESKGPHNPHNNAFFAEETKLPSELAARRRWDFAGNRYWRVISEEKNRAGGCTAWRLMPGRNTPLYTRPEAMFLRRAGFINYHLWATPFNPYERYPGGDYPNQNPREGDGLPFWTQQDRSLEDQGIVLWYCFGVTRQVRLEDWPVTPGESIGFSLQPDGFFDRSPCVGPINADSPPAVPTAAAAGAGGAGGTGGTSSSTSGPTGEGDEDQLRSKL